MSPYLVLLGVLVLLVFGGGFLKKLLKKVDIDLDDEQLDDMTKAVSDAIAQVEKINSDLVSSGGKSMSEEEKIDITIKLARDLAIKAGVSQVKIDVLLKLLDATLKKEES